MPKLLSWCLVLGALAITATPALACGDRAIYTTSRDNGTKVGIMVSDAEYLRSPSWTPGTGEPPLAVAKAVELALKWAKTEYKRFDDVRVQGIDINTLGCSTDKSKWYYLVDFTPIIDGNAMYGSGYFVAILMDGTVIPPRPLTDGK